MPELLKPVEANGPDIEPPIEFDDTELLLKGCPYISLNRGSYYNIS